MDEVIKIEDTINVDKVTFSKGEKGALTLVFTGVAIIGYGLGRFVVEPVVKKGISKCSKIKSSLSKGECKVDEEVFIEEENETETKNN